MALPKHVAAYGSQLVITMDDGARIMAQPTNIKDAWVVSSSAAPTPPNKPFYWPFDPNMAVTSEYGPRTNSEGEPKFHEGIDFGSGGVSEGDPIYCTAAGRLEESYYSDGFGFLAIVNHGYIGQNVLRTVYAHMLTWTDLPVGIKVTRGQIIGRVGNTGRSYGYHLHWETHECLHGRSIIWNTNDDGGMRTAINPRDFMTKYGNDNVLSPTP